jgi:hypothetical protein
MSGTTKPCHYKEFPDLDQENADYPQYHARRMARRRTKRPAAPTLAQAMKEYLDWQALDRGRSPNTVRAYGIDLAGFRAFAGAAGIDELAGVDRDLLREFQVAMARGRRTAKPLSPQTRHRWLVALRSCLRLCAREEWFVVGLDARGTTSL